MQFAEKHIIKYLISDTEVYLSLILDDKVPLYILWEIFILLYISTQKIAYINLVLHFSCENSVRIDEAWLGFVEFSR